MALATENIRLRLGDIVESSTDALVNAANRQLVRGGGVDGAIHRAAGPELQAYLRSTYPQGCPTGQAVPSPGFRIPVHFLIHAVGPVWHGGGHDEEALLRSAYRSTFQLAGELRCRSVAAPAISTGIYGFPLALAAPIAVTEARTALSSGSRLELIEFVLFDRTAERLFARALKTA